MKLQAVQAFLQTHESGSISEAAKKMGKSRVMVSNWIGSLEDQWGVALFDRKGHKPVLTHEGEKLLMICRSLLTTSEMLERKVASLHLPDEENLSFGIDHGVEKGFIWDILQEIERQHPAVNITLKEGFDDELLSWVDSGELDFAYTGFNQLDVTRFTCQQIGHYDFVAVCHRDHLLATHDEIELTDMNSHRQISARLHPSTDASKVRLSDNFWQMSDYQSALALVKRGLGWTVCPKSEAIEEIRLGNLVILNHPQAVYRWPVGLIWRIDHQPGPVMQDLIHNISANYSDQ